MKSLKQLIVFMQSRVANLRSNSYMHKLRVLARPAHLSSLMCALLAVMIFIFGTASPQVLNAVISQTDWSGMVGTGADQYASADNIVTVNDNELSLDTAAVQGWCNTANCTTDWSRRQRVHMTAGDTGTNPHVLLSVDYKSEMKADFSDLRFLVEGSNEELQYYVLDKTDSQNARVWVRLGNILNAGAYTVFMYYGNGIATSLSSPSAVLFEDGFDGGNIDNWNDYGVSPSPSTDGNGFVVLDPTENYPADWLISKSTFNTSVTRTFQYDFVIDNADCSNGMIAGNGMEASSVYHLYETTIGGPDCNSYTNGQINQGGTYNALYSNSLQIGQKYTARITVNEVGSHVFTISDDNGKTFRRIANYDEATNATTDDFNVQFSAYNGVPGSNTRMKVGNATVTTGDFIGIVGFTTPEHVNGRIGNLESRIIDTNTSPQYGTIDYTVQGTGNAAVQVRTSPNSDMSGTSGWYFCLYHASGQAITSDTGCTDDGDRYVQYRVVLSADAANDLKLTSITINYQDDQTAPDVPANIIIKTSPSGSVIANNAWTRELSPYFSWDVALDNTVGDSAGLAGYCAYFGSDSNADPVTTKGIITDASQFDTNGACEYGVSNPSLDISAINTNAVLQNNETYYFTVKSLDEAGNLSAASQVSLRIDTEAPFAFTLVTYPTAVGSKIFRVNWLNNMLVSYGDSASGFAGIKYCITTVLEGLTGCEEGSMNYYGLNHTSGDPRDPTDVIPFTDGGFTTVPADSDRIDDLIAGVNGVYVIAVDYAGNVQSLGTGVVIATQAVTPAPENLQVTPTSNSSNEFSFSWEKPSFHFGGPSDLEFCWTVNVTIATDGSNCNWTGKNVYALAQGAYATRQGSNTLYIATQDVTQNFDGTVFSSINFNANTSAPGQPRDLDSSDASIKATNAWKVALSWTAPTLPGSGISTYKIYRSTDNASFTEVGTTNASNTGFVDTGLSQVTYYYYVKACDNAGSCSVASDTVSRKPTGRFTVPARLTADTDQPKVKDIGTKKATIFWFTDRDSDSKIAYGTSSGKYNPEEVGNTSQTGNHTVSLSNLSPGTTYYYIAKWTDADGNTGQSGERSFTTLPPPAISEVEAKNISINGAQITFRSKDASKIAVYYGKNGGFGGATSINTATRESTYTVNLKDLDDGVKYTFKLNGVDSDGNEYPGNTYSFTTLARPKISNVRFQPVAGEPSSTQKVTWDTNVPATSELSYGPKGVKKNDLLVSKLVTQHEMIITSLQDDTEYELVARSTDSAGNSATSDVQVFRTELDTRQPTISDISVESSVKGTGTESKGQIIVTWKTDEPSTGQVAYGQNESGALSNSSSEDTRLSLEHTIVISDLPTSAILRLQPISRDKARNQATGAQQTAIIGRGADNVFSIIFNALRNIFGIGG